VITAKIKKLAKKVAY